MHSVNVANRLLAALPREEYERLLPNLEPVRIEKGRVIYEAGDAIEHAWFINSGVVSLLAASIECQTIEVGLIGNEGLVGVPALMQIKQAMCRVLAQTDVEAMQIKAVILGNEFKRCGPIHQVLMRYLHVLMLELMQSAFCNNFHSSKQRLARWLLSMQNKLKTHCLPLTHEFIAQMLGKPRARVTTMIGDLQKNGLIRSGIGQIFILDRAGLEAEACECYWIINEELANTWKFDALMLRL
jgi:CRP-like cAMP-binding protein